MIHVSVQLMFDEYLRLNYRILFRRYRFLLFILAFVFILGLVLAVMPNKQAPVLQTIGLPFAFVAILMVLTYFQAKSAWTQNQSLGEPTEYVLTDNGVSLQSPSLSAQQAWTNFHKLEETERSLLLFLSANQLLIFPKTCFSDTDHLAQFKTFVSSHLTGEKQQVVKAGKRKLALIMFGIWLLIVVVVFLYNWAGRK